MMMIGGDGDVDDLLGITDSAMDQNFWRMTTMMLTIGGDWVVGVSEGELSSTFLVLSN